VLERFAAAHEGANPTATRILETAIAVIAERGYDGTSVHEIAEAADAPS
jgi:AcrR family transcriptional regulator